MRRDGPLEHRGGTTGEASADRTGIARQPDRSSACTCASQIATGHSPSDDEMTQSSCPVHRRPETFDQEASFISKAKTPVTPSLLAHERESSPWEADGIRLAKAVSLPKARARIVLVSTSSKSDIAMSLDEGGASVSVTESPSEDKLSNLSELDPKALRRINSDLKFSGTSTPLISDEAGLTESPTEIAIDGSSARLAGQDRLPNPANITPVFAALQVSSSTSGPATGTGRRALNLSCPRTRHDMRHSIVVDNDDDDDDNGPPPVVGEKPSYFRP